MTKLSVNINKIATLRNAVVVMCPIKSSIRYSKIWEGITIHPRQMSDIWYQDARI
jgi:pyridoxine 5'-phosphate synthase PdxJ